LHTEVTVQLPNASSEIKPSRIATRIGNAVAIAYVVATTAAFLSNADADDLRGDKNQRMKRVKIETLSTRPNMVSGGEVLVEITYSAVRAPLLRITLNERDVTGKFRAGAEPYTWIGLLDGLKVGRNILRARGKGPTGMIDQRLQLTDYPSAGPIFSGPQIQPYQCMTDKYILPDGSYLGPSTDVQCSAPTKVQYVYKSTNGKFLPMPDLTRLPEDVATTTTLAGITVPYVVRFEAGTRDRGVYNIAILHDPTVESAPTPFVPPKAWVRKLMWVHGFGCAGGWYYQGTTTGSGDGYDFSKLPGTEAVVARAGGIAADFNVIDDTWLSKGYAVATSTLNHPSISCNPHLAGEVTSMVKEHFIDEFGVPAFTVSTGGSGGAYSSEQIADAFPGLIDGILVAGVFPDSLSIGLSGLDGHLLTHYFAVTDPTGFSEAQEIAVSGYQSMQAFRDAANQAGRTDPVPNRADIPNYLSAVWHSVGGAWPILYPTPGSLRYDPVSNPRGARPTIFDVSVAVYGRDPKTGFALRPVDNVGVQYGLAALNDGTITTRQFLDLNADIGGYDQDANYVPERTSADPEAIKRTYQSGLSLSGGGGLASIPVFDFGSYNDAGGYHYQWFHFAIRERLTQSNGNADNHVLWRGSQVPSATAAAIFDEWVTAYKADKSNLSQREKVIRHKPKAAVDGCWASSTQFITEPQTFNSQPNSQCNKLFPSYSAPRLVAGGPLAGNVLKCELRPIDAADYKVKFITAEMTRLRTIFPAGVCDWSKPGINKVGVVTWASFGPSPDHLVFDVTRKTTWEAASTRARSAPTSRSRP
jgi:hypothetical protein